MKEVVFFAIGAVFLFASVVIYLRAKAKEYNLAIFVQGKIMAKISELNETAQWLDNRVSELVARKNQLDNMGRELFKRKLELDRMLMGLIQNRNELIDIKNDNQTLIEQAAKKIREVKHEQFYVKESAVLIYDHYQHVVEILNGFVENQPDTEKLFAVLGTANNNLLFMGNYFKRHFGISPEEYKNQRVYLGAKDKSGNDTTLESSKN